MQLVENFVVLYHSNRLINICMHMLCAKSYSNVLLNVNSTSSLATFALHQSAENPEQKHFCSAL